MGGGKTASTSCALGCLTFFTRCDLLLYPLDET
jgi:hypothetical protein